MKITICLPDVIIIGANKAATTSVAGYLDQHPEIHFSKPKEPMFFTELPSKKNFNSEHSYMDLRRYSSLFEDVPDGTRLFGEASTSYLANPQRAAPWIRKLVPDVKLICILRDPVDRAISAYRMMLDRKKESRSFSQILENLDDMKVLRAVQGSQHYVENGLYNQQVQIFLNNFSSSSILFLTYDEVVVDAKSAISKMFDFIKVDPVDVDVSTMRNVSKIKFTEGLHYTQCDLDRLRRFYQSEVRKLHKSTGVNCLHWLDARK